MSGNATSLTTATESGALMHPMLRYAVGSTIISVVAMTWDYTLAYLTPVLALNFLAPGAKPLTVRSSVLFLLSVAIASVTGVVFSGIFLPYPLVFLPLLALILFLIYYTKSLQNMKLWLIISLLVIPMASMKALALGSVVAVNLFINALVAMLLVWLVWFIFPRYEAVTTGVERANAAGPGSGERFTQALGKVLVVIPVLILFFVFNLSDSLLVLVFIAVLSMNPATANKKVAIGMILANLGGGLAAIIAFNLIAAATSIVFFGLLTLLAGLIFANKVFSRRPAAPLFGMAFSTYLLILGNVVSLAGEAGDKVWLRIMQIGIAMIYMLAGFGIVGRFKKNRKNDSDKK